MMNDEEKKAQALLIHHSSFLVHRLLEALP